MSSKEETTEKKSSPPPKKGEKPVNPDLETCIRDKIAEGKSEEEARTLCEQEQDAPPEGQPSEKAPAPDPSGVEELPEEQPPAAPGQQQAVPPNPLNPVAPNADPNAIPPNGVPPTGAPPTPGAMGQYQNFEGCLQAQLSQGLVNKDAVVNCAAQLLQTLESQGMATQVPPMGGGTYNVQGATVKIADFPGGFEECVLRFKKDGMDKDAAISKCEGIFNAKINKAATAADYIEVLQAKEKTDKLYVRAFLLDPSVNVNDWGVSKASIDERIQSFVGRPLVLTEDFGHPELSDMTFGHALKYQDIYRIGTIVDVVQTAKDDFTKDQKVWYAICEVTDEKAKEAFRGHKLPLYVSPAVAQMNFAEQGQEINEWLGMHLAIVDKPAFGIKKAMITGSCSGEKDKCVMHLRQAKIEQFGYGNCGFCTYEKLVSVLPAKVEQAKEVIKTEEKGEKLIITPDSIKSADSSQRAENTQEQLTMSQQSTQDTKVAETQPKVEEKKKEYPQQFGLLDARLVKLETENTLLKEHLKKANADNEDLREENSRLNTSIRRANIASIITAEVIEDETQRMKTIDMFTEKGLTPDMVADLYATVRGNVKTAKESVYEARVPLVKTAKSSSDPEASILSKEFRNILIKGGSI